MMYLADYLNGLVGAEKNEIRTALIGAQQASNLFDKTTATIGYFLGHDGSAPVANGTYDYSDFISVSPGQSLVASNNMRFTTFYNVSKNWVTGGSGSDTSSIVVPTGVAYVRVTISHSDLATFSLMVGVTTATSKWSGKTWASLGDSLTAGNTWQGYVAAELGLTPTVFGVGGTKISGASGDTGAMCQDARINAIATTFDLVTLMGGTNDWAQNVVLGAAGSTDPTTFNGALNAFAAKAFARWPAARIALVTTPYGEILDYTSRGGWADPAHNSLGLTTNDYAAAIRDACSRLNLPCIDVARDGGWGATNIQAALGGSTSDHLHPGAMSSAAKGIAIAHRAILRGLEPLAA